MNHREKAKELFLQGYNCSQAVFAAFSDITGVDETTALRISSSFGGGMGHMGEVCGAVTGMFMAAGMVFGYDCVNDPDIKQKHNEFIKMMADKFKEKYQSVLCRDLLKLLAGGNFSVPEGANPEDYKRRPCLFYVEYAVDIMDELLWQKKQELLK